MSKDYFSSGKSDEYKLFSELNSLTEKEIEIERDPFLSILDDTSSVIVEPPVQNAKPIF